MIQSVFNGMITLMLAKFMLNDVPHAMGHFEEPYHKPRQHEPKPTGKIITVPGGAQWRCAKCGVIVKSGEQMLRLGGKVYCVECARSGNPTPTGTCYQDAWRYVMQHPEGVLAHGTALSAVTGKRVGHAWIELPDSTVWEPYSQAILSIEEFYRLVEPVVEDRYTAEEAAIMLARAGKHGPWSAEERKEYIGR